MALVSDEFPEVMRAAQAARILTCLERATSFTAFAGDRWRVCCDGEWFTGENLADALAQAGQWLEAREVQ